MGRGIQVKACSIVLVLALITLVGLTESAEEPKSSGGAHNTHNNHNNHNQNRPQHYKQDKDFYCLKATDGTREIFYKFNDGCNQKQCRCSGVEPCQGTKHTCRGKKMKKGIEESSKNVCCKYYQ